MDDPSLCAILVPVFGSIEPEVDDKLRALANRGYIVRILRGSSQIDLARSTLATRAMRDGFKETMWIDSDVVFDPDDVDRIRSHGKPFTAGLYVKKGRKEFAGKFRDGFSGATFGVGGGLIEMQYVGMGFTHIRAEVYDRIASELKLASCTGGYEYERVTPYFLPMLVQEGDSLCYMSEDFSFCCRARQAGYAPLADTTVFLGHVGKKKYTWDDLTPDQHFESAQLGVSDPAAGSVTEPQKPQPVTTGEAGTMSANLYEQLGRKQEVIESQDRAYQAILDLLAGVVGGQIDPSRILVNQTERSWKLAAEGDRPAMPGTINGVPVCVVSVDESAKKLKADKAMLLGAIRSLQRGTLRADEFEIDGDDCKVVLKSRSDEPASEAVASGA